jgi:hypothetical protein
MIKEILWAKWEQTTKKGVCFTLDLFTEKAIKRHTPNIIAPADECPL